jgi:hypothetical protein
MRQTLDGLPKVAAIPTGAVFAARGSMSLATQHLSALLKC